MLTDRARVIGQINKKTEMMTPQKTVCHFGIANGKLRNLLFVTVAGLCFCACQPNAKKAETEATGDRAILKSTELAIPSDSLRVASQLVVLDSLLVFKDYKYNPLYEVYNLKSNQLMSRFGKVGDGPSEFDPYAILQNLPGQPGGLGFCMRLKFRYRNLGMADLANGTENYMEAGIKLPTAFQQCVLMPNGNYLRVGIFDGRYTFADPKGNLLPPQLDYPFAKDLANLSFGAKAMLLQGSLLVWPDGQRTLFAYRSFPGWEICQVNGLKVEKKAESLQSIPLFSDVTSGDIISVELKIDNIDGYVGASVNQELIVLLYLGRSEEKYPRKSSHANQIHPAFANTQRWHN